MENTNENAQEVVVEQEEQTTEEELLEEESPQEDENFIKIPKDRFKSMQRKAMAYDATRKNPKPLQAKQEPVDEEVVKSVRKLEMIEQKRQFGYDFNLSPEETDFIFKFSGGKPNKETLENPFVKSGLEGFRASKRLEANTPNSSSSSKVFQGKEFTEMTEDERRKAFEESNKKFRV